MYLVPLRHCGIFKKIAFCIRLKVKLLKEGIDFQEMLTMQVKSNIIIKCIEPMVDNPKVCQMVTMSNRSATVSAMADWLP